MTTKQTDLISYFASFISDSKKQGIEKVLANRTRHITVVLEDIFQPHNASAVIRSCDCFGIQDLHIIENANEYTLNPNVTQGSSKWVDLIRYNDKDDSNTERCIAALKEDGYQIYATSPHYAELGVTDIPLDQKIALLFGTELNGLSTCAKDNADEVVRIPMFGFTESLNLSVSVALFLHVLIDKLRKSKLEWGLSAAEREILRLNWYRKSVRNAEILEKAFMESNEI